MTGQDTSADRNVYATESIVDRVPQGCSGPHPIGNDENPRSGGNDESVREERFSNSAFASIMGAKEEVSSRAVYPVGENWEEEKTVLSRGGD
jgi:hypothetical protein